MVFSVRDLVRLLPNTGFKADRVKARIVITPPDNRKRDKANMEGACKPYIDGVADAIRVDDYYWGAIEWIHKPANKPGSVVFEIEVGA